MTTPEQKQMYKDIICKAIDQADDMGFTQTRDILKDYNMKGYNAQVVGNCYTVVYIKKDAKLDIAMNLVYYGGTLFDRVKEWIRDGRG